MRTLFYSNPSDLQIEAEKFFAECELKKKRPTITGLCYSLGFQSKQSFYDYSEREDFVFVINRLRLKIESGYEEGLSTNNPTGSIFALKNMGWKDKTEQDVRYPDGIELVFEHWPSAVRGIETKDNGQRMLHTKGGDVPM